MQQSVVIGNVSRKNKLTDGQGPHLLIFSSSHWIGLDLWKGGVQGGVVAVHVWQLIW